MPATARRPGIGAPRAAGAVAPHRTPRAPTVAAVHPHCVRVTSRTTWLLVEARTGEEVTGWGEFSDVPGGDALPLLAALASRIRGADLDGGLAWLEGPALGWAESARDAGERLLRRTVVGGLATALSDAAARHAQLPLRSWLSARTDPTGGTGRTGGVSGMEGAGGTKGTGGATPITLYANINRAMVDDRTPEAAAALARRAVADGFRAVKCAPFDRLPDRGRLPVGLEIARAVRDAVGDSATVLLDVHHHLTPDQVLRRAEEFRALRLGWLEDAAALDDLTGLRRLRDGLGVPLAGGEFAGAPAELLPALRAGLLDVVLPDVKHAGGPLPALRLARLAADHGARVSFHNPSGPIATAATAHLTALLAPDLPLELMHGETTLPAELPVTGGTYTLPTAPGLGIRPAPTHPGRAPIPGPAPIRSPSRA